ncbi:MAG: 3-dehydroquinate synthase [Verrucomicrobia bacterium]|nr:3-dehydroquinate synthase [Verrucomicrobiota bacterium]
MNITFSLEPIETKISVVSHFTEADFFWDEVISFTSSIFLLSEETAGSFFNPLIEKYFSKKGINVTTLTLQGGEKAKSISYLEKITDFMLEKGMGRDVCLIALGGGAFLDVAGFIASIYARGISFIAIPTTLLSMVDACIGGKTAINTFRGKNTLGTFYPACRILIALECLNTLPKIQTQSALAEIIKYSLILDKDLFTSLQQGVNLWENQDPFFLKKLILASLQAKKSVIEKDLKEQGLRRILNFGHTIAHALESLWNYQVPHGYAVAIGLLIESHLSFQLGLLSFKELNLIVDLFKSYNLIQKNKSFCYEDLESFMQKDKKNKGKDIRFVVLSSIGKAHECDGDYCKTVSKEDLLASLSWYKDLER